MKPLDITFIVPTVRTENWEKIIKSIEDNIGENSFEVIFVGPSVNLPETLCEKKNIKTIRDFGCPSRALQIASLLAEGEYLSWICDDGFFIDNEIGKLVSSLKNKNSKKFIYNWIYTEGDGYLVGDDMRVSNPKQWYRSDQHSDMVLDGIDGSWQVMPLFTIRTSYFHELGGIDCGFETINYNLHDLSYRAQRDGCEIQLTDNVVFRLSWQPIGENRTIDSCPVLNATVFNDRPYLNHLYGSPGNRPISIDLNNWKNRNSIWKRRWK